MGSSATEPVWAPAIYQQHTADTRIDFMLLRHAIYGTEYSSTLLYRCGCARYVKRFDTNKTVGDIIVYMSTEHRFGFGIRNFENKA